MTRHVPGLGEVPDGWDVLPARRVLSRQKRPVRAHDEIVTAFRDGQVTLRRLRRMDGFTEALQEIGYHGCREGDLAVHSMDGFAGAIGVCEADGKVSPVVHLYRPVEDRLDTRYAAYILRHLATSDFIVSLAKGIRERSTSFDPATMADVSFPVPPIVTQRRIADFLDDQVSRLDVVIRLRGRQRELIDDRERVAIRDAVAGNGHGTSPPGAPWVGPLASRAQLRPLSRLLTLQRGVDLALDDRTDGAFPVITTAGVVGTHHTSVAQGPGVVIGRYGSVGNVFWVDTPYWPHNTTLYVKDFMQNRPRFVFYLLRAFPYERLQARAAVPGVNRNDMKADLMPWLPVDLQDACIDRCDSVSDSAKEARGALDRSVAVLNERKQALITAAVTGQFDVTTARAVA